MTRQLKVYGWISSRRQVVEGHGQTREVIAAPSVAEIERITGRPRRSFYNLCETGNPNELDIATAEPGVVFWHPLDERPPVWRRDA